MVRIGRRGFLLGATAALAGCAQVDYAAPAAKVPATFEAAAPGRAAAGPWWSAFRDPTLDQLIAAGRARNLDVLQAIAAIEEARASVSGAGAADLPQVSGTLKDTRGNTSGTGIAESRSGALAVGWTADLFGANRSNRAAASARLDAAYASADVARLVMEGAIAQAYAELRYQQASIALTRKSLESRRKKSGTDAGAGGKRHGGAA
ncbi:TolC family protein [Rhodobacter capsulatus]